MNARLILDTKTILTDGRIIQRKVWKLPRPTLDRPHGIKFRLYCGAKGKTIVRYDNESGKGSHRHIGEQELETGYDFVSLVQLLTDFAADIVQLSGEIE
ncbi:MAG: hypothetical protein COS39_08590 [Hydrogenophilales bacterium CG03_land_8_20_14_0_80_62_28]|nr:MAG: hypothetical protein COS39_08590 [Hydrogenophilales bacterium CG03_land_8_20_14_0_80_62_28]PIX02283.1 MAG: hypothetical protein COZ79_02600 [Hydrogenophilales bacterium CG_4_8_14_3_um_filter_62_83]PIY98789.1 MAG: hypothetical protein COY64_04315 [Hydrogenophilales bacterium CG_4_10_14_0_8_um_filter_62_70]